ncbi:MAG: aminopeptidase P family N-terminal domain-containing protein, partial [Vicinamibacterales bacterium]
MPISRRRLLGRAAAASAAALVARTAGAQGRDTRTGALPASIVALSSMRAQATPITADERRTRIEQARALMKDARLDAVLIPGGTSLTYFAGARWGNSERLMAVVIPASATPFVVIPAFEEERVREQLQGGPLGSAEVHTWQEDESPFARLSQALRDRGMSTGRLGIEETTKFVFADSLAAAAPALKVASATPVVAGCRMIKSDHEVALMRLACRATLACYQAVYAALAPGMTEDDVRALVSAAYGR